MELDNKELLQKTFLYCGQVEVRLTGRAAERQAATGAVTYYEIEPVDSDDVLSKKWARLKELFEIMTVEEALKPPEEEFDIISITEDSLMS